MRKANKKFLSKRSAYHPWNMGWMQQIDRTMCHMAVNSKEYQLAANKLLQNMMKRVEVQNA